MCSAHYYYQQKHLSSFTDVIGHTAKQESTSMLKKKKDTNHIIMSEN